MDVIPLTLGSVLPDEIGNPTDTINLKTLVLITGFCYWFLYTMDLCRARRSFPVEYDSQDLKIDNRILPLTLSSRASPAASPKSHVPNQRGLEVRW